MITTHRLPDERGRGYLGAAAYRGRPIGLFSCAGTDDPVALVDAHIVILHAGAKWLRVAVLEVLDLVTVDADKVSLHTDGAGRLVEGVLYEGTHLRRLTLDRWMLPLHPQQASVAS